MRFKCVSITEELQPNFTPSGAGIVWTVKFIDVSENYVDPEEKDTARLYSNDPHYPLVLLYRGERPNFEVLETYGLMVTT